MPRIVVRLFRIFFFLLLGVGMLSHVLSSSARDSNAIHHATDPDSIYAISIPAIVYELQRDDLIEALEGGLFEMSAKDTREVVTGAYDAEYFSRRARDTHASLVRYTLNFPPPDTLFFLVSLERERPVLLDRLLNHWRQRIQSLPSCSPFQLAEIGFGALLAGTGLESSESFAKGLPRCRPPESLEKKLLMKLEQSIEEEKKSGSEFVSAFPKKNQTDYTQFRRSMTFARGFAHSGSWPFLALLVAATLAFVLVRSTGRPGRARAATWGLIGIAVLLVLCGAALRRWGGEIDLWALVHDKPRAELSASTVHWFTLVFYLTRVTLAIAAGKAFVYAGACLAGAALVWFAARRSWADKQE